MKIYFAGSIRGGRGDAKLYQALIADLQAYGEVLTEHVGASDVEHTEKQLSEQEIHDRDMAWLSECDAMVAEVSTPSLGVGYEIGRGVEQHKKILCLFRPQSDKSLSAMIAGCDRLQLKKYRTLEAAKAAIDEFFGS